VQFDRRIIIAQEIFDEEVKMHYGTIKTRQRLGLGRRCAGGIHSRDRKSWSHRALIWGKAGRYSASSAADPVGYEAGEELGPAAAAGTRFVVGNPSS